MAWLCVAGPAAAFFIITGPSTVAVVEYYNTITGHYFMTADPAEEQAIAKGKSGPGWVRTGLVFGGYPRTGSADSCVDCGIPVYRFYGPGPNSHVFTADPVEAEILRRPGSGWIFEREEFRIPVPDASGQCIGSTVPVVRFYNDRFRFNDANHRYVTSDGERGRMRSRGWLDEGARFCALMAREDPLHSFALTGPLKVLPSAQCEDEALSLGPCVAVNNLVPPSYQLPPQRVDLVAPDFFERTGFASSINFVQPARSGSAAEAAEGAFVQGAPYLMGIHVATPGRGGSLYSSVNPLYQFRTAIDADGRDRRYFPWATAYESEVQLSVSGVINVKRLRTAPGSHAYGHPTLEFIDQRSGRHLYFTALTYGTVDPNADYLAPDVGTGKVIVGTTFRASTPYGRHAGIPTLHTPSPFQSGNYWGWGGAFDFRIDRAEFQRIVNAARTVDPALSADPRDYMFDNFHFCNEVVGDGEIGLNLADFKVQVLRR